jgi:hypothetical protein
LQIEFYFNLELSYHNCMKLHGSVVEKLVRLYDLHGGRKDNTKLIQELKNLDLSSYQQKENPKHESFIVLTEQLTPAPK